MIGGGIVGAGIAAHAAREGLAVALVDRRDFGSGTSAASSKLIHGGLRYLRLGDFSLVREAHRERRLLMQTVAPHLVRRLPFLLPLYRDGPYRPATVHAGVTAYCALARARLSRPVSPARARVQVPALRTDGLRSCAAYGDAVTHDSRLCLANVRAAHAAGATVVNYAAVKHLRIGHGRVAGADVLVDGESISVDARAVVNASGPWVDHVRLLEDANAAPSVRLSKGVHLVLALDAPWSAALVIPHDAGRVSFGVPWEGMLLLGTTDSDYEGSPDLLEVTPGEIDQVLDEAAVALNPHAIGRAAIRSSFAGLRVLPLGDGGTATARREAVVTVGAAGMLTVAGGKLTTYRALALRVLRELAPELRLRRISARAIPLPGAVDPVVETGRLARTYPEVEAATIAHLVHLHGGFAADVLALGDGAPELHEPIDSAGPDVLAQIVYAVAREWALCADDVLRRRTTVAVRVGDDATVRARVKGMLADFDAGA